MKKYLLGGFIVLFTSSLMAQNKKILGNWKENYHCQIDTTSDDREKINADPEAYRLGYKKLEIDGARIIDFAELDYTRDLAREISIKEDLGFFWLSFQNFETDFAKKIIYDPKNNNYVITKGDFSNYNLIIEYDNKNQKLLFFYKELGIVWYEFSRN